MKFLMANRRECADRTPLSGKTTFPDVWPTGKFSWRELLTVYARAGLVEYLTATRQELWFWPSGNQLWAIKKNYTCGTTYIKFSLYASSIYMSIIYIYQTVIQQAIGLEWINDYKIYNFSDLQVLVYDSCLVFKSYIQIKTMLGSEN